MALTVEENQRLSITVFVGTSLCPCALPIVGSYEFLGILP